MPNENSPYPYGSFGGMESGIQATATDNINSSDVVKYLQITAMCFDSVDGMFVF